MGEVRAAAEGAYESRGDEGMVELAVLWFGMVVVWGAMVCFG